MNFIISVETHNGGLLAFLRKIWRWPCRYTSVTDATLTLNSDYKWTGVLRQCSGNTFSSRSEDSTGGLSSNLPPAPAPSHLVTPTWSNTQLCKWWFYAASALRSLRLFCSTCNILKLSPFNQPLPPLPAEPPLLHPFPGCWSFSPYGGSMWRMQR